MKKFSLILLAILITSLIIGGVSAQTLNGSVTVPSTFSTIVYNQVATPYGTDTYKSHYAIIHNIQYSTDAQAMVRYDPSMSYTPTFDAGSPVAHGATTTYTAHLNSLAGATLFTGTISYQRLWNALGVEIPGYQALTFDSNYNTGIAGLTGDQIIYLDYTDSTLNNMTFSLNNGYSPTETWTDGMITFYTYCTPSSAGGSPIGNYNANYKKSFNNAYSATKPSGLGIQGYVNKTNGGITYNSMVLIYDGTSGAVVSSESIVTSNDFNFNVPSSSIIVGMKDTAGVYHNSSVLFSGSSSGYSISFSPVPIQANGVLTGILNGDISSLKTATWVYSGGQAQMPPQTFFENQYVETSYVLNSSGYWNAFNIGSNLYNYNKGTSLPNPIYVTPQGIGTFNGSLILSFNDGSSTTLYAPFVVGTGNDNLVTITATDAYSGALITPVTFSVQNLQTGNWTNATSNYGYESIAVPIGTQINVIGSSGGYYNAVYGTTGVTANLQIPLKMYTTGGATTNNLVVYVLTTPSSTQTSQPINGALVKVINKNNATDSFTSSTNAQGSVYFSVNNSATYTVLASGLQYTSAQQVITMGASTPTVVNLYLTLVTATPTATPGNVKSPTITPTVTLPGSVAGNYTGFWAPGYILFHAMGADDSTIGYLMAGMLILCGFFIGAFGAGTINPESPFNPVVGNAGAIFGLLMAVIFGFISIIYITVIIIWTVLSVFALRR